MEQGGGFQQIFADYRGGDEMPLASYAKILAVYNAAFVGLLLAAQQPGRELPKRLAYGDLALLGVATYKLSRLLSSDRVRVRYALLSSSTSHRQARAKSKRRCAVQGCSALSAIS